MKSVSLRSKKKKESKTLKAAIVTMVAGIVIALSENFGIELPEEHAHRIAGGIVSFIGFLFYVLRLKTKLPIIR